MAEKQEKTIEKPPVVAVLGHVDHGKSTLLEAIKNEIRITAKESGGITQHIGAYQITSKDKKITFVDTPGHEAFSAMRMRGARVADIAVLVIDATKGVQKQTKEAISFIKKAEIPIVVALNKVDRKGAVPDQVCHQLVKEDIVVESLNGDVPAVNVSAKNGEGIEEILENIGLVAEMEKLKADTSESAEGTVIEGTCHSCRGPVATVIVNQGVLRKGDVLGTSSVTGKARSLFDFNRQEIEKAYPGQPVQILGFERAPKIGEKVDVFSNRQEAEENLEKDEKEASTRVIETGKDKEIFNVILKADVLGSLQAIQDMLRNIPQEKVVIRIIKSEVGNIGISDIQLAESCGARIFGFRVKMDKNAKFFSGEKNIKPKIFEVVYELIEEIRKDMEKVISPEVKRVDLGKVKIVAIFKQSGGRQIVGGKVIEGEIINNSKVEVLREEERVGGGELRGLQKEKQNIDSAKKKEEVGMMIKGAPKIKEKDTLVFYQYKKEKKSTEKENQ